MLVADLPTPALVADVAALRTNLREMTAAWPGASLRPHVKAHKCTSLARWQHDEGHPGFTCATPREVVGMAAAGLGDDLLLANEVLDARRIVWMADAAATHGASITIAVDSDATVRAAAAGGLRQVLIDVNVGLPRCGCDPSDAGRLADLARSLHLEVRGVMGYEGHAMTLEPLDLPHRAAQAERVEQAMERLRSAHTNVGGDVISAGGTGTYDLHATTGVSEIQAGSYVLMDSHYGRLGLPFRQALFVVGTVISVHPHWAVIDVGLKALGMDHGPPTIDDHEVFVVSDEHITFRTADRRGPAVNVGDRINVIPAHVDPTMAMHDTLWVVDGDDVIDDWPIDLRGW